MKEDRLNLLIMLLIALFMGSTLLVQYQKPLVITTLDRIFGKPKAVEKAPVPPPPKIAPASPPVEKPAVHSKLPRQYEGIKFLTSFAVAKPYIIRKYNVRPKRESRPGEYWRMAADGTGIHDRRREIILENMGKVTAQKPRYINFKFYDYSFIGVVEKYYGIDPKQVLGEAVARYGIYDKKGDWEEYDRYIWDNGQMQIVFLSNQVSKTGIFSFQIKKYATELK